MDYSKWDKIAAEVDDDEDRPGPRVTRLDQASRVSESVLVPQPLIHGGVCLQVFVGV